MNGFPTIPSNRKQRLSRSHLKAALEGANEIIELLSVTCLRTTMVADVARGGCSLEAAAKRLSMSEDDFRRLQTNVDKEARRMLAMVPAEPETPTVP
ncbi:MAG: hypothetical protein K8R87_07400 [Verrucomicrobia bacterium]|nr:hypothetical protein [Verrucomicrobiota bacterium]